jgi:hypothetical protein
MATSSVAEWNLSCCPCRFGRNIRVIGSSGGACAGSFLFLPEVGPRAHCRNSHLSSLRREHVTLQQRDWCMSHVRTQADIDACVEYIKGCAKRARGSWRDALRISEYVQGERCTGSAAAAICRDAVHDPARGRRATL